MKTSLLSLVSFAVLALTLGADAQAQGISINFGGGSSIQIRDPFTPGGQPAPRPRPVNPVIDDQQSGSFVFNQRTGQWELKRQRDVIHESALDWNRDVVDPGSMRAKSSIARDSLGNTIETTVTSWTSYGVPHSKTTTRRIQSGNGGRVIDEVNVMRSTNPMAGRQAAPHTAPQADDSFPGFDD